MRGHRRHRDRDAAGFALVEAVVTLSLLMVVLAMFLDSLGSLTNSSQRVQALVANEETVRFGLDQMQRDLRAATALDALTASSGYGSQIRFELGPAGSRQYLRWLYDTTPTSPTYQSLLRQVMAGPTSATVLNQGIVITRAENVASNTAVFTYFDSRGADLVAANPTTPANVADCTIAVHIEVDADSQPGPQPFSENIDVELRNRLPGGIIGCPA